MKITLRKLLYKAQWGWVWFLIYAFLGKNFFSMLRAILMIVCTMLLGDFLKISCGTGWISYAIAFFAIYFLSWAFLLGRILLFFPFPVCRKGKCNSIDDYSWFHGTFFGKCKWGVYWYKCHCGDQYLRRGKRFLFIPEPKNPPSPWVDIRKGTTRPYKKLVGFRKWADDTEPN